MSHTHGNCSSNLPLQLHAADEAQRLLCSSTFSDAIVATHTVEDPLTHHVHCHTNLALQGALRFPENHPMTGEHSETDRHPMTGEHNKTDNHPTTDEHGETGM